MSKPLPFRGGVGVGTLRARQWCGYFPTIPTPTQFGRSWSVRGTDWAKPLKGRG
jgi:hypothetical protein